VTLTKTLMAIMETDVPSLPLNSVVGSLWRAVYTHRGSPAQDEFTTVSAPQVERTANVDDEYRMKNYSDGRHVNR